MKIILVTLTIIFASITTVNADSLKQAHLFKAAELEVEAQMIELEVAAQIAAAQKELKKITDFEESKIAEDGYVDELAKELIEWNIEDRVNPHIAEAERLKAEALRLRTKAALHRSKAEGN